MKLCQHIYCLTETWVVLSHTVFLPFVTSKVGLLNLVWYSFCPSLCLDSVVATAWLRHMKKIGPRLLLCITPTVASILTFSSPTYRRYFTLVWIVVLDWLSHRFSLSPQTICVCSFLVPTVVVVVVPFSMWKWRLRILFRITMIHIAHSFQMCIGFVWVGVQ